MRQTGRIVVELSDWELVLKCQAGDMEAFQELVLRYHQKIFLVIIGLLRNREDALDVAQEVFFRGVYKI
jgi:RNA polymerase sigma-70 factor (ECF subfamily)